MIGSTLLFVRSIFFILCMAYAIAYAAMLKTPDSLIERVLFGGLIGAAFAAIVISLESLFKRISFRAFSVVTLGLVFGYLFGQMILLIFGSAIDSSVFNVPSEITSLTRISLFLVTAYIGMTLAAAADQVEYSIPFLKAGKSESKRKQMIIDLPALLDVRIVDLAASGLLDKALLVPRLIVKELSSLTESPEETQKSKGRRGLEVLRRLEGMPSLALCYIEDEAPAGKDMVSRLAALAAKLDADLLTADASRTQLPEVDGVKIINLHFLASALKPVAQSGEVLSIKIQRYGKEPRQGVGYLDDGTMVVINGGAEYIGETIKCQVLSLKHTSSGRMIFCNALDENGMSYEPEQSLADLEHSHKNYFSL